MLQVISGPARSQSVSVPSIANQSASSRCDPTKIFPSGKKVLEPTVITHDPIDDLSIFAPSARKMFATRSWVSGRWWKTRSFEQLLLPLRSFDLEN